MFQFPTNGKAYPKSDGSRPLSWRNLSFNSLRTGRHIQRFVKPFVSDYYYRVSIPYEREGISKVDKTDASDTDRPFQFPTNGKAYPKLRTYGKKSRHRGSCVSIPYEREGISKDPYRNPGWEKGKSCFNSLRTGRHIQR